jgi:plastocyanin
MFARLNGCRFVLGLMINLAAVFHASAAEGSVADAGVSVMGRIGYQADPARPWTLGRYYLNNGSLAEAVVALEAPGLTGAARAARTLHMDQKDFQFVPEIVAIRSGDSVRFTNSDEALHNVMTFQGAAPLNVNLPQGKEYVHQFPEGKGLEQQIQLTCVFHGAMRGWVFVFPHPHFAVTGKDGQFRFENVPPGEYRLRVVHPAGEFAWSQPVTLKKGAPVEISVALSPDQKKK